MLFVLLAVAVAQAQPDGQAKVVPVKWKVECKTDEFTDARSCLLMSETKVQTKADDALDAVKIWVTTKSPTPSIYFGMACADVARVDKNEAIQDNDIHLQPLKLLQQMLKGSVLRYRTKDSDFSKAGTFAVTLEGFPAAYAELFRKAGVPEPKLSETGKGVPQ